MRKGPLTTVLKAVFGIVLAIVVGKNLPDGPILYLIFGFLGVVFLYTEWVQVESYLTKTFPEVRPLHSVASHPRLSCLILLAILAVTCFACNLIRSTITAVGPNASTESIPEPDAALLSIFADMTLSTDKDFQQAISTLPRTSQVETRSHVTPKDLIHLLRAYQISGKLPIRLKAALEGSALRDSGGKPAVYVGGWMQEIIPGKKEIAQVHWTIRTRRLVRESVGDFAGMMVELHPDSMSFPDWSCGIPIHERNYLVAVYTAPVGSGFPKHLPTNAASPSVNRANLFVCSGKEAFGGTISLFLVFRAIPSLLFIGSIQDGPQPFTIDDIRNDWQKYRSQ